MQISYTALSDSHPDWAESGLSFLAAVGGWSAAYEQRCMVPHALNRKVADETTAILLWDVPAAGLPAGRRVVSALLDDRLREAMMYERPPAWLRALVLGALRARKLLLRYAFLPRPAWRAHRLISDAPDPDGRSFRVEYESEPWYVRPTLRMRWGLQAWLKWLVGRPVPGDGGGRFKPEGYVIKDVGPEGFVGKGAKEVEEGMSRLMGEGRGGCPFGGGKGVVKG